MSDLTPLRDAVDTLADRALPPDFGELERRAARRGRRRLALGAAAAAAVIGGSALAVNGLDETRTAPIEQPKPGPRPNGWVAVDAYQGDYFHDVYDGDVIYLARPGEEPHQLQVAGSDAANDACPTWSPDGTRLMFGRLTLKKPAVSSVRVPRSKRTTGTVSGKSGIIGPALPAPPRPCCTMRVGMGFVR